MSSSLHPLVLSENVNRFHRLVAAGFNPTSRGEILTQILPVMEQEILLQREDALDTYASDQREALAEKDAQISRMSIVLRELELLSYKNEE